jgi:chromosome segregation ATPase
MKTCFKAMIMIAALCVAGLTTSAGQGSSQQQSGDPVADAARKAREEKKNAPKPKKVITDDDVSHSVQPAATAPANPPSPDNSSGASSATAGQKAEDAAKPKDDAKPEDPNSEKAWRKRFSNQRAKIAKAEKELDILQREDEKAQVQYYPDPQKTMTEQNTRKEINEKTAKINAKKQEIAQLKQELDDLEDQLRKSGADPGWAR